MRKKASKYSNLPPYLYAYSKNKITYYRYKPPGTDKFIAFGTDPKDAINAALQLNAKFVINKNLIDKATIQILGNTDTFEEYAIKYRDKILPARKIKGEPLTHQTLNGYKRITNLLIEYFGKTPLQDMTQKQIAEYLDTCSTPEVFNMHKLRLSDIYKHAISDGYSIANLPDNILKQSKGKVERHRINKAGYDTVYKYASTELRNAMELAINIMQRRENIVTLKFENIIDGYMFIKILKTARSGTVSRLRISTKIPVIYSNAGAKTLNDLIKHCKDDILSPFLIHRNPEKRIKSKKREHWTQILPDFITREFADAVKLAQSHGFFKGLTTAQTPTLHECIALGEHLRKTEQSWTDTRLMTFRGHTNEKMTRVYLDGHDWTTIEHSELG